MLIVKERQRELIMRALGLMAEMMQIVIQISNGGGGVVYDELLAVVYLFLHLAGRTKHKSATYLNTLIQLTYTQMCPLTNAH